MNLSKIHDEDWSHRIAFNPNQRQFMQDDRRHKIKLDQFQQGRYLIFI